MATPARELLSPRSIPAPRDLAWQAVESMPAGALVYESSGRILYANPKARRILGLATASCQEGGGAEAGAASIIEIFGFSPHSVIGQSLLDEPESLDRIERGKITTGKGSARRTLGYKVGKLGTSHPGDRDAGQPEDRYVLIFQDITQLEKVREERDRYQHLASMARLFPTIAHEIKNPLAAIQGVVEILLEDLDGGAGTGSDQAGAQEEAAQETRFGLRGDLEIVLEEVARLRLLVDRMGVTDQRLQTQGEPVDLVPIVQKAFRLAARRAEILGLTLEYKGPSSLPLPLHKDLILMILHNLINNAIEASKRGGSITVCLYHGEGELALLVLDTGSGMSTEEVGRATEPFFSTKNGSTGVGLALIEQLVKRSDGRLTIWSRPGEGTEVEVRVPELHP